MSEQLLEKAKLLMAIEGYEQESVKKSENAIDIKVSKPNSDETVLMHIVINSELGSNTISVDKARTIKQLVDKEDVDKLIIFSQGFTKAAERALNAENIEFFSDDKKILSIIPPIKLYSTVTDYINQLCQTKCGSVPKSASECKGYSEDSTTCTSCGGSGKIDGQTIPCKTCKGVVFKDNNYPCKVRLISDNVDYHQEKGWLTLLQNDLLSLIKIMRIEKNNGESENKGESGE